MRLEPRLRPEAIEIERPLQLLPGEQRNHDQCLGLHGRPGDLLGAGIIHHVRDELGLPTFGDRPSDAGAEWEGPQREDLRRVPVPDQHGVEEAKTWVRAVDGQRVVRDELAEAVRDRFEDPPRGFFGDEQGGDMREEPVCRLGCRFSPGCPVTPQVSGVQVGIGVAHVRARSANAFGPATGVRAVRHAGAARSRLRMLPRRTITFGPPRFKVGCSPTGLRKPQGHWDLLAPPRGRWCPSLSIRRQASPAGTRPVNRRSADCQRQIGPAHLAHWG